MRPLDGTEAEQARKEEETEMTRFPTRVTNRFPEARGEVRADQTLPDLPLAS